MTQETHYCVAPFPWAGHDVTGILHDGAGYWIGRWQPVPRCVVELIRDPVTELPIPAPELYAPPAFCGVVMRREVRDDAE